MTSRIRTYRRAAALATAAAAMIAAPGALAAEPHVIRDVMTGHDALGTVPVPSGADPIQDYTQPDTQAEPSIAVNPSNPDNVVAGYQEGRIANGGDATNGYATSFDGGKKWTYGELPGLTTFPGQTGSFERASDAVIAFGPNNTVYANSLIFDQTVGNALRSGIAVNVSRDGGRTWSQPVVFQDDQLGGLNDKNWIVVDNGTGPGHHPGRVYVVWDRIAPVLYNYCDANCDQAANWLPNMQTVPGLVFPGQGIGAYPVVTYNGGLGIVMDADSGGLITREPDQPEIGSTSQRLVYIGAPTAGQTPYPAPIPFLPPININTNLGHNIRAQRAGSLPAAAADPNTGMLYAVWEDGRLRSDGANDVMLSSSRDDGLTWNAPVRVNGGPETDNVDHYNPTVSVTPAGFVEVAYRQRAETGTGPSFPPAIDTMLQQSTDAGRTFSSPVKVNSEPSNAFFDAFSRDGSFEGDYNEIASGGSVSYIVRAQGAPAYKGEPAPLVPTGSGDKLTLIEAGKGHQHQRAWVAAVDTGA